MLALRKTVIDTAMAYLNEKEDLKERRSHRRRIFSLIAILFGIAGGAYYLFFHVISGFRL